MGGLTEAGLNLLVIAVVLANKSLLEVFASNWVDRLEGIRMEERLVDVLSNVVPALAFFGRSSVVLVLMC